MSRITNIFNSFSNIGSEYIDNPFIARKVKLYVQIVVVSLFVEIALLSTILSFESGYHLIPLGFLLVADTFTIYLVSRGDHLVARMFGGALGVATCTFNAMYFGVDISVIYLFFVVGAFAIFDYRSEVNIIFTMLGWIIMNFLFLHLYGFAAIDSPVSGLEARVFYYAHYLICFILITLMINFYASDIARYEEKMVKDNYELKLSNFELEIEKRDRESNLSVNSCIVKNLSSELNPIIQSFEHYTQHLDELINLVPDVQERSILLNNTTSSLRTSMSDLTEVSKHNFKFFKNIPRDVLLIDVLLHSMKSLRLIALQKNIQFEIRCEVESDLSFSVDELKIRLLLINLISNAIKHTDKGGVVVYYRIMKGEADHELEIEVIDTGSGMDLFQIDQINDMRVPDFDNYENNYYSGLGLSVVQSLIKVLSGSIFVESAIDEGTTVTVILPVTVLETSTKI